jgi:hypothetical protein
MKQKGNLIAEGNPTLSETKNNAPTNVRAFLFRSPKESSMVMGSLFYIRGTTYYLL